MFYKKNFLIFFFIIIFNSIFSNEFQKESLIIENFLTQKISGMPISYRDFFDILIYENIPVYLHGGPIRDLLSEPSKQPRDVDFVYSCSREKISKVLKKYGFKPIGRPNSKVIMIGNLQESFLEGYSNTVSDLNNVYLQEFSVNSVLYDLERKTFSKRFQEKLKDIKDKRLRLLTNNWDRWITHNNTCTPHYKIFRFFKMISKGYSYHINFEYYMKKKTEELSINKEEFKEYLLMYLGTHYSLLHEIKYGAKAIMGEKWCLENIEKITDEIYLKSIESDSELSEL